MRVLDRWFDVPVNDPLRVCRVKSFGHIDRNIEKLFDLYGTSTNQLLQCLAF